MKWPMVSEEERCAMNLGRWWGQKLVSRKWGSGDWLLREWGEDASYISLVREVLSKPLAPSKRAAYGFFIGTFQVMLYTQTFMNASWDHWEMLLLPSSYGSHCKLVTSQWNFQPFTVHILLFSQDMPILNTSRGWSWHCLYRNGMSVRTSTLSGLPSNGEICCT